MTTIPDQPPSPRRGLWRIRSIRNRPDRRLLRARPQPLHAALAVGLGCDSIGYRFPPRPEWY